jgi:hypothetical protein
MHQMQISTAYVSSVMVRPTHLEIQNVMTLQIPKKPQADRRDMEPNPSIDRVMHGVDNLSFQMN